MKRLILFMAAVSLWASEPLDLVREHVTDPQVMEYFEKSYRNEDGLEADHQIMKKANERWARPFLAAIGRNNPDPFLKYWSGLLYFGQVKFKGALLAFNEADKNFPDYRARFFHAKIEFIRGNMALMGQDIALIVKRYPNLKVEELIKKLK